MHFVWNHCRQESWAYTALAGIISVHVGVVIMVFGFKGLLGDKTSNPIPYVGIIVAITGVALVIASGVLYRRQRRHLRPCICCGDDNEDANVPLPPFRRLRFAPNLVSPYYIEAVSARPEQRFFADKTDKNCPNQLFKTSDNTWRKESDISGSQTYTSDTYSQASPSRKKHRKTPC